MNPNIGWWLYNTKGCRSTTYMGSDPYITRYSVFDPQQPWVNPETRGSYLRRWGYLNEGIHDFDPSQAQYARELFSNGTRASAHMTAAGAQATLTALARRADNPFNLVDNLHYNATLQDGQDCMVVAYMGEAVYDSVIRAMLLGGAKPLPTPVPLPLPGPLPLPLSVALPVLANLSDRVVELEAVALRFLDGLVPLTLPLSAAQMDTGLRALLAAARPFTVPLLAHWRRCRQALGDLRPLPLTVFA